MLRGNALDDGFLAGLGDFLLGGLLYCFLKRHINHLVGRFARVLVVQVIMAQPGNRVGGRLEMEVWDEQHGHLVPQLNGLDVGALLVEQEGGDIDGNLDMHGPRVLFHCFFFQDTQDVQRGGFSGADMAGAGAARARDVAGFSQGRTQPLARQFHQAETADLAHLHAGTVESQRIAQAVLNFALVALVLHVDEVDDDQAAQVAQTQLASQFFSSFEVGFVGGFLNVGSPGGATRVDVDGDQCLGVIDDDSSSGGQIDLTDKGCFDLVLDLETREQRHVIAVTLDAVYVGRHDGAHEGARLFVDLVGIDKDFADFRLEVITDGTDDQAAFEVDQESAALLPGGAFDGVPELQQIVQIPLQFFSLASDGCRAGDQAHAVGHLEFIHRVAQFGPLVAINAARDATATRVVRHQDEVAAGKRNIRGQGRTLVSALVLVDLNDQFLAFLQRLVDLGAADLDAGLEIGAGNFFEGQKAVPLGTVVDEAGFKAGFDTGDDALVDVALALFLGGRFNVEVNQFLAIDNGDTEFFGLCRIEKHAFHDLGAPAHQGTLQRSPEQAATVSVIGLRHV